MEIVIDIPKEIYDVLYVDYVFEPPMRNGKTLFSILQKCIANGTPLPKGHGDLIDRRELKKEVYTTTEWNGDVHRIIYEASIDDAKPIIEADKESE